MKAIRVSFEENAKPYYFNPNNLDLRDGEIVIVDTNGCRDNGRVVGKVFELDEKQFDKELKKIIKKANHFDMEKIKENNEEENSYFAIFKEKVEKHELELKPVRASLSFDGRKIIFFYFAENKVDFRVLLKDLLTVIKKKIELRQIEAREEAKLVGGIGVCGQRCCCNLFLSGKEQVGIKMAKEQGLPLNPEKISGICGKLMCCLRFENEAYKKQSKDMPRKNKTVYINNKQMRVMESNVLLECVKLREILNEKDENGDNLLSNEVEILTKEDFLRETKKNDRSQKAN